MKARVAAVLPAAWELVIQELVCGSRLHWAWWTLAAVPGLRVLTCLLAIALSASARPDLSVNSVLLGVQVYILREAWGCRDSPRSLAPALRVGLMPDGLPAPSTQLAVY